MDPLKDALRAIVIALEQAKDEREQRLLYGGILAGIYKLAEAQYGRQFAEDIFFGTILYRKTQ